jgi:hypothetical protein
MSKPFYTIEIKYAATGKVERFTESKNQYRTLSYERANGWVAQLALAYDGLAGFRWVRNNTVLHSTGEKANIPAGKFLFAKITHQED